MNQFSVESFAAGVLLMAAIYSLMSWFVVNWAWDSGFEAGKLDAASGRLETKLKGGA